MCVLELLGRKSPTLPEGVKPKFADLQMEKRWKIKRTGECVKRDHWNLLFYFLLKEVKTKLCKDKYKDPRNGEERSPTP